MKDTENNLKLSKVNYMSWSLGLPAYHEPGHENDVPLQTVTSEL